MIISLIEIIVKCIPCFFLAFFTLRINTDNSTVSTIFSGCRGSSKKRLIPDHVKIFLVAVFGRQRKNYQTEFLFYVCKWTKTNSKS